MAVGAALKAGLFRARNARSSTSTRWAEVCLLGRLGPDLLQFADGRVEVLDHLGERSVVLQRAFDRLEVLGQSFDVDAGVDLGDQADRLGDGLATLVAEVAALQLVGPVTAADEGLRLRGEGDGGLEGRDRRVGLVGGRPAWWGCSRRS